MIDLNTLVSNALIAAVQQAVAPLNERIATLELQRGEMQRTIVVYSERISALENNPAQGQDLTPAPTTGLTRDEVEALIEAKMDLHLECYDHDNYDEIASKVDDLPDLDDYVTRDEVRSEIEDVLNNATLSLSV